MLGALKKALSSLADRVKEVVGPKEVPTEEAPPLEEQPPEPSSPPKPAPKTSTKRDRLHQSKGPEERTQKKASASKKLRAKVSLKKKLTTLISPKVVLDRKDIEEALDEFELYLLKAEVALPVAEELKKRLERALVGKEVDKTELSRVVQEKALETLLSVIEGRPFSSLLEEVKKHRPYVIMLFGPNGAGKTTTAAKLAKLFKGEGYRVLLIAADTFRAASIEQLKEHASRIGVDVFEKGYEVKPSTVIYEGLEKARREGYDVVIIDTAGRQEVNVNLMKELEKMVKVAKPHLKLYVVESIGGNAVFDQVSTYHRIVGIDGLIITKVDLDERGGVLVSASYATGAPIFFISRGQEYTALEPYSEGLVREILS